MCCCKLTELLRVERLLFVRCVLVEHVIAQWDGRSVALLVVVVHPQKQPCHESSPGS